MLWFVRGTGRRRNRRDIGGIDGAADGGGQILLEGVGAEAIAAIDDFAGAVDD